MLKVPAKQLDDLASAIRITVINLQLGNGLKVQGPNIHGPRTEENCRRAALLALHALCGEPVWPADTVDLDGFNRVTPPFQPTEPGSAG